MSYMGNGRHLAAGTPEPSPPGKDVLRVYGMKFCPYVHRLKLVLAAKEIKHETININLARKPDWFLAKFPLGKVPCIEKNGETLYESDITSNYVDEVFPGRKLTTDCSMKKAKEMILMTHFSMSTQGFYGLMFAKTDEAREAAMEKMGKGFQHFENYLQSTGYPFICKDQPGMTDYMVWPHLERITAHIGAESLQKYPMISAYSERMSKHGPVIACRHSNELLSQFGQSFINKKPTYDIGIVEEYSKL